MQEIPSRRSAPCLAQGIAHFAVALLLVEATAVVVQAETALFSAVYWDLGSQRWRDTATTPYEAGQIGSYDYASATVQFEYTESGSTLTGVLTGSRLKPNFTYQLKLNGKPSYFWGAAGDDVANEWLGFAGRWWLTQVERSTGSIVGGWNSDDEEYAFWQIRDFTDGTYDFVFEGYLLFGYVVTDTVGNVSQALTVDSSFHVLWKTTQRLPGANDSEPVAHVFVVDGASDWYASSQPDEPRSVYAEWEPTRALPGELSVPVGSYAVRIFLTEESFHENASPPPSGRWATVMTYDDLRFAITPPTACSDGVDNDQDGRLDFDPVTFANPGDQHTPPAGFGDPACFDPAASIENAKCQDGINNDTGQDTQGLIDYDGGQSIWGYCSGAPGGCPPEVSDPDGDGVADPDPQCVGTPWKNQESKPKPSSCGLGAELALLLPTLMWVSRKRRT